MNVRCLQTNGYEMSTFNDEVVDTVLALIVRDIDVEHLVERIRSWIQVNSSK